jgi:hypothetical protein
MSFIISPHIPTVKTLSSVINAGPFGWKQFFLKAEIAEVYVQAVG